MKIATEHMGTALNQFEINLFASTEVENEILFAALPVYKVVRAWAGKQKTVTDQTECNFF